MSKFENMFCKLQLPHISWGVEKYIYLYVKLLNCINCAADFFRRESTNQYHIGMGIISHLITCVE